MHNQCVVTITYPQSCLTSHFIPSRQMLELKKANARTEKDKLKKKRRNVAPRKYQTDLTHSNILMHDLKKM